MKTLAIFVFLFSISVHALIDTRNANYSDSWVDFVIPGQGYDLKVERTYNSRTLFNGIHGFGWCSNFESKLEITPEGNLKIIECGGGLEITYATRNFKNSEIKFTIDKIIGLVQKRNKSLTKKYLVKLRSKLVYDSSLRQEFANQLKIFGKPKKNATYFAEGRANETLSLKSKFYVRRLPNGTYEKYNLKGQLVFMYDKNNQYIKIVYKNKRITTVSDNRGRRLNFKYFAGLNKVKEILGPNKLKVRYKYSGEDLVFVENAWKNKYRYKYDELHNLTMILFPDKTKKIITYDKNRDWVLSFQNRKNCKEIYTYKDDKKDPLNHYWSNVTKTCGTKVTNNSSYEFFHKKRKDGSRYLYRSRVKNNGGVSDIVYHNVFGKPTSIYKNGILVRYKYYKNGLLHIKREKLKTSRFTYKNSCMKVSKVVSNYLVAAPKKSGKTVNKKGMRIRQVVTTKFNYDKKKCNLTLARNSLGQSAALEYDYKGRIYQIKDQAKKIVKIKYNEQFGKPVLINRPGLGTIKVKYKKDGSISSVDSKQGPRIATQVANVFNTLLEIISPATGELTI